MLPKFVTPSTLVKEQELPIGKPQWGRFIGRVETWWEETVDPERFTITIFGFKIKLWATDNERIMVLIRNFAYEDPEGKIWLAPAGSRIDGASIPWFFWRVIGDPLGGRYRRASVVHDVGCEQRVAPSKAVHRMFYYAMRCAGVSQFRAWLMYIGVRFGGPRWPEPPEQSKATTLELDLGQPKEKS